MLTSGMKSKDLFNPISAILLLNNMETNTLLYLLRQFFSKDMQVEDQFYLHNVCDTQSQ